MLFQYELWCATHDRLRPARTINHSGTCGLRLSFRSWHRLESCPLASSRLTTLTSHECNQVSGTLPTCPTSLSLYRLLLKSFSWVVSEQSQETKVAAKVPPKKARRSPGSTSSTPPASKACVQAEQRSAIPAEQNFLNNRISDQYLNVNTRPHPPHVLLEFFFKLILPAAHSPLLQKSQTMQQLQ